MSTEDLRRKYDQHSRGSAGVPGSKEDFSDMIAKEMAKKKQKMDRDRENRKEKEFKFQNAGSLAYVGDWEAIFDRTKAAVGPKHKETGRLAWLLWRSAFGLDLKSKPVAEMVKQYRDAIRAVEVKADGKTLTGSAKFKFDYCLVFEFIINPFFRSELRG